jgi:hypothetical protein
MSRKVTVQLTFGFTDDFTDADIREHIDTLLHRSVCDIDEQLLRVLSKNPIRKEDMFAQKFALKFCRADKKRLKAALKTLEVIQIEG